MPLLRSVCTFLVALAFVLGTIVPAPHGAVAYVGHDMTASTAMEPMTADGDHCDDDAAVPIACAKVFCAGSAMILAHAAAGLPAITGARFASSPDLGGSGLTRLPDSPPPRTVFFG